MSEPTAQPNGVLLTVGHGTAAEELLVSVLAGAGVDAVVDVRRFPGSRRHPHFGRDEMARWLPAAGIGYRWDERLGGRRAPSPDSPHSGLRHPAFRAYADHMATAEFREAGRQLVAEAGRRRVAVLCSESLWWRCHRRLIADHLTALTPLQVCHLSHDGRLVAHRLTDAARVATAGLVYDRGEPSLDLGEPQQR